MLIVEDFLLIMLDPRTGVPLRADRDAQRIAAAALLLDLAEHQRLHLRDNGVQADDSLPVTHPLLDQATQILGAQTASTTDALETLTRKLSKIPERVADGMVRRDILHRIGRRSWFLLRRWRYPLRSMQARNESLLLLRQAAVGNDMHGLSLLLLVEISGLLSQLLDARKHESAEQRLNALNQGDEQADETLRIVASVRRALLE